MVLGTCLSMTRHYICMHRTRKMEEWDTDQNSSFMEEKKFKNRTFKILLIEDASFIYLFILSTEDSTL
uniref:Uncharacterized protein n=1 Tax=Rhizophora mucronata TaxID=61149 RepID=A0A2P2NT24_RHIMU